MVRAVAEGKYVSRPTGDIEFARVRAVLAFVSVTRPVEEHCPASFWDGDIADGDISGRSPAEHLRRCGQPEKLVDRIGYQFRLLHQQTSLLGSLVQQLDCPAKHAGGGVVASGDHREGERQNRQHTGDIAIGADSRGHQVGNGIDRIFQRLGLSPLD